MSASAYEKEKARFSKYLVANTDRSGREEEIRTTPLFSLKVKHVVDVLEDEVDHESSSGESPQGSNSSRADTENPETKQKVLPQYGLLGHLVGAHGSLSKDEPVLLNVNAPNSVFLCGSQGSGKSYTLSCMLENCLLPNLDTGRLETPVAGVVFHYDVNSTTSAVAEAAHLCSRGIKVNVLVSQSKDRALTEAYSAIDEQDMLTVKPFCLRGSDLSIDRMHKLMAFAEREGAMPLYMEVVQRILREMAVKDSFNYIAFRNQLNTENLTKDQNGPLGLRLQLLDSFLHDDDKPAKISFGVHTAKRSRAPRVKDSKLFDLEPGSLTIVDLSDPFLDAGTVCILFDIALGLIQEQRPPSGLVVALDEAHKFMNDSTAAANFTNRLLTTIREQRHNATRVIIATQEPTISPRLLDLCSISIIHRFSSPAWFTAIQGHLGGASKMVASAEEKNAMFERIVGLDVGQGLVFCPAAFLDVCETEGEDGKPKKLGAVAVKMKTRSRLGTDGGMSVLAGREA